jgi:hypothetical protein
VSRTLSADALARLESHPLAEMLPPMLPHAFEQLRRDIETNGQRTAIVLHAGKILDGRHRVRALVNLGRPGLVADFPRDQDARSYVLSANVQRRHLSTAQSAMVAARLVTTRQGAHQADGEVTQLAAAEMLSVSIRYVRDAQWLIEHDEALADEVFNGDLSLTAAIRRARPPVPRAREPRPVLIDPHPPVPEPAPLPQGFDIIIAAIELMRSADPGVWVNGLQPEQRSLVTTLDTFARGAYDVADESGMI